MDWPVEDAEWSAHDLKNFDFEERATVSLRKLSTDESVVKDIIWNKNDWETWFDDIPNHSSLEAGVYVILCSRAEPVFDGAPSPISYLSMTRGTWQRLCRAFHVSRSIIRVISRQVACFTSVHETVPTSAQPRTSFTARMSANLPDDVAVTVTYTPSTQTIFAVFFGCSRQQMVEVERRVHMARDKVEHPLLTVGIFAELERERLVAAVDQLLDRFTLKSEHLEGGGRSWDPRTDMSSAKTQENLSLCLQSRSLADHIRAVKRQVAKLVAEIDRLGSSRLTARKGAEERADPQKGRRLKKVGIQMKKRLAEILDEYDDKIDECDMIQSNTSLAMQTVWNDIAKRDSNLNTKIARANTNLAMETKREGTQMRSIALLTMIYLPISSVAAIFSMDLFNWGAGAGESVVSQYIWIFAVLSLGLTALTLFAWRHVTYRHEKKKKKKKEGAGRSVSGGGSRNSARSLSGTNLDLDLDLDLDSAGAEGKMV
ncbi:hypothetical protein F4778DRAFT_350718 [Xylariomycetidae sp. FL2044]|nr:hypothetical protein F4778DRAFT_350718 [Xylariomycetidae sp. FL2044]